MVLNSKDQSITSHVLFISLLCFVTPKGSITILLHRQFLQSFSQAIPKTKDTSVKLFQNFLKICVTKRAYGGKCWGFFQQCWLSGIKIDMNNLKYFFLPFFVESRGGHTSPSLEGVQGVDVGVGVLELIVGLSSWYFKNIQSYVIDEISLRIDLTLCCGDIINDVTLCHLWRHIASPMA